MPEKPSYEELEQRVRELERQASELKKNQKELLPSKDLLQAIIEAAPFAIIGLDLDGHVHSVWNPAAEKMLGWRAQEVMGRSLPKVPRDCQEEFRRFREPIRNGKTLNGIDVVGKRRDGTPVVYSIYASPLHDAKGRISGNVAVLVDRTEHKQAEEALRASEKRFSTIFHDNPAAMALTKVGNNRIFEVNEAWEDITGYRRSEVIGSTSLELNLLVDPNQREKLSKILQEGGKARDEVHVRRKSGEVNTVLMSAEIIELSGENYLLSMAQDLTEQKNAEKALGESEKKYRNMMEAFADPLCICSPNFTVEYMNPAMIRRIGRDATGEMCFYALHGLHSKCDWCVFDKVSKGNKVESNIRSPLDERDYHVTIMPIQNKDGTTSAMTIYRDITDYLKAVSEKKQAQAQLIQFQKMESIGNLAGGIAHDFNNILSSILGFTELSLDDARPGGVQEDNLREILAAGRRAKDLVRHILTFARQSGEEIKPLQPSLIAEEVIKFLRSTIPTTINIKPVIESESLIMGNPTQVHQLLMNLCTNAAQAMEEKGGTLEVGLTDIIVDNSGIWNKLGLHRGDYIEIKVSDSGRGIPPEHIASVFEPYFTTKAPGEGTGMGLAMVHGIINSYGGKITVHSEIGSGTTFAAYLPITKKRQIHGPSEQETIPTGVEHILFIDDEAPIAKIGHRLLKALGYAVTIRTSSVEALELFKSKPDAFDLVVTDLTMPNLTGDALAREMMAIRPEIPVILCTGYSKKFSEASAADVGIKAFAYKPMVKADLAKTIRKVLDEAKTQI